MKANIEKRESNIELLRILLIIGVIILHYNNVNGGGGLKYAEVGTVNRYILFVMESIFICAVDLFMIISGYFMITSETRNLWKPIKLLTQVSFFRVTIYLVDSFISDEFVVKEIIGCLVPINYFVILYVVVYFLSPYLNIVMKKLNKSNVTVFMIIMFFWFSIYPTFVDILVEFTCSSLDGLSSIGMFGSQSGYTCVNFLLCYSVGACVRLYSEKFEKVKFSVLLFSLVANVFFIVLWSIIEETKGWGLGKVAWEYCNPFVISTGLVLFLLFKRIKMRNLIWINVLAKGSFTVFLVHNYFLKFLDVKTVVKGNSLVMLATISLSALIIYIICWLIYCVYYSIEKTVFGILTKKIKLPQVKID